MRLFSFPLGLPSVASFSRLCVLSRSKLARPLLCTISAWQCRHASQIQHMKNTLQFKTKSGFLTSYALACGYVERAERANGNRVSLSREGSLYHVRGFRDGSHFANAFNYIGAARCFFNSLA